MTQRRLTPSQRAFALAWWEQGKDTFDIAVVLTEKYETPFHESVVYNSVFHPHSRDAANVVPLRPKRVG